LRANGSGRDSRPESKITSQQASQLLGRRSDARSIAAATPFLPSTMTCTWWWVVTGTSTWGVGGAGLVGRGSGQRTEPGPLALALRRWPWTGCSTARVERSPGSKTARASPPSGHGHHPLGIVAIGPYLHLLILSATPTWLTTSSPPSPGSPCQPSNSRPGRAAPHLPRPAGHPHTPPPHLRRRIPQRASHSTISARSTRVTWTVSSLVDRQLILPGSAERRNGYGIDTTSVHR
jgi:hypothetical protein